MIQILNFFWMLKVWSLTGYYHVERLQPTHFIQFIISIIVTILSDKQWHRHHEILKRTFLLW